MPVIGSVFQEFVNTLNINFAAPVVVNGPPALHLTAPGGGPTTATIQYVRQTSPTQLQFTLSEPASGLNYHLPGWQPTILTQLGGNVLPATGPTR